LNNWPEVYEAFPRSAIGELDWSREPNWDMRPTPRLSLAIGQVELLLESGSLTVTMTPTARR
jgi:hypothetical protein